MFQVDDFAIFDVNQVRLRFEIAGPGTVWIDDVQLDDERTEFTIELGKLNFSMQTALADEKYGDGLRLLEGFWPRFLATRISLAGDAILEPATVQPATPQPTPPVAAPPEKPGVADRLNDILKWPPFRR
jgi:hypothetical protein